MKLWLFLPLWIAFFPQISMAFECEEEVKQAICVVDPAKKTDNRNIIDYIEKNLNRPCLPDTQLYIDSILKNVKALPTEVHPVFCHVKRIFVENEFYATGYAGTFYERVPEEDDEDRVAIRATGWVVGLTRSRVFGHNYSLSEWLARKEMTLFGLEMTDPIPENFPHFHVDWTGIPHEDQLLYEVLLHEAGHILDFANQVNDYAPIRCKGDPEKWRNCELQTRSMWSLISWNMDTTRRAEADFWPTPLCYYGCKYDENWEPLDLKDANRLYLGLARSSGFISPYAAANPSEDFAESLTHYFGSQQGMTHLLMIQGQLPVNMREKVYLNAFVGAKYEFLEDFFARDYKVKPQDFVAHILKDTPADKVVPRIVD